MAPVDTKQKYRKLYLSKKCRMKINNATLRYLKCTLFQRVLDQAILSDAITTVYIICYQLLSYAKNTILANFVEVLLRLFCDITGCCFRDTQGHLCNNLGNPHVFHELAILSNWGICPPNTI